MDDRIVPVTGNCSIKVFGELLACSRLRSVTVTSEGEGEGSVGASDWEEEVEEEVEVARGGFRALVRRKYKARRGQRARRRVPAYSDTP